MNFFFTHLLFFLFYFYKEKTSPELPSGLGLSLISHWSFTGPNGLRLLIVGKDQTKFMSLKLMLPKENHGLVIKENGIDAYRKSKKYLIRYRSSMDQFKVEVTFNLYIIYFVMYLMLLSI